MSPEYFVFLFNRELIKLAEEVESYKDEDTLWEVLPGTSNSGGALLQHLIGNLRTFVGLGIGDMPYKRDRYKEFSGRLFCKEELVIELNTLKEIIVQTLAALTPADLEKEYPHDILDLKEDQPITFVLCSLLSHLAYHRGQINYHRRALTGE